MLRIQTKSTNEENNIVSTEKVMFAVRVRAQIAETVLGFRFLIGCWNVVLAKRDKSALTVAPSEVQFGVEGELLDSQELHLGAALRIENPQLLPLQGRR